MPYELAIGEPLSQSVPRIAREQVDRALAHAASGDAPAAERVHETRKRFKEMRALLRLVRDALGDDFALENAWYRDAGRTLAGARDAEAMIESLDRLRTAASEEERRAVKEVRWALRSVRTDRMDDEAASLSRVAETLPICRARITTWPPLGSSFSPAARGFQRTYRDGRRAMKLAIALPSPERFHEWRKRVKDHWYHAQLLRNVSAEMRGRMAALQQLSRALGDQHDLAVLEHELGSGALSGSCELLAADVVRALAARVRSSLERQSIMTGSMLYAEQPSSLRRRLESAWRATSAHEPTAAS